MEGVGVTPLALRGVVVIRVVNGLPGGCDTAGWLGGGLSCSIAKIFSRRSTFLLLRTKTILRLNVWLLDSLWRCKSFGISGIIEIRASIYGMVVAARARQRDV